MSALGTKLRSVEGGGIRFHCPGCNSTHGVSVGEGPGPRWGYNGDPEAPTFTPSILVTWNTPSDDPAQFDDTAKDKKHVCHSYITDGQIQFLSDCTHSLAGQTVELPEWPS